MSGTTRINQSPDFGKRDDLKEIDEESEKFEQNFDLNKELLKNALISGGYLESSLVKKFVKERPMGIKNQEDLTKGIAKAIYDLPTCKGIILNGQINSKSKRRSELEIGITALPWAEGEKGVGPMYLCMNIHYSKIKPLIVRFRIVMLDVDDDKRTVLVTEHVCDRIAERAGIKGSHVAFVADSIIFNEIRIEKQSNKTPLLTIFDRHHNVIGYCPIASKKCGLQRTQDALKLKPGRYYLSVQNRWRLKTFEPVEHYVETEDGYLIQRKSIRKSKKNV